MLTKCVGFLVSSCVGSLQIDVIKQQEILKQIQNGESFNFR